MLNVYQAIEQLCGTVDRRPGVEQIGLRDAIGRTLAQDVHSQHDVPPADNSAMDGYALRYADWPGEEAVLPVSQRIQAGATHRELAPGSAARIFTGAEIPPGADTVVMQENTRSVDAGVVIGELPDKGANIRPQGQDIQRNQCILQSGTKLRSQEIGLLASVGLDEVSVFERLKVAIVSTGDELREPGEALSAGQIYNSNRYLLGSLMRDWEFEAVDIGIAPDDPLKIEELLEKAAECADVVLSSGGVSVGEEDHVKAVVERLGALDFWKIAMKPGKPLAFGRVGDTPFIGLPGNPASAFVTCLIIARPFLLALQGRAKVKITPQRPLALFSLKGGPRQVYIRARQTSDGVELYPNQSSGVLLSASWGNGLVVQAPEQEINVGDRVDFIPYDQLG